MVDPNGAWVFISHSNKDWYKVRRVRNMLEDNGHKPLLFFLKCLNDDSELDGLIRREIEARSWFLLCNSPNAERSQKVQMEVAYIQKFEDKFFEEINMEEEVEKQIKQIQGLSRRVTVFISSASEDQDVADRIRQALENFEYRIWENSPIEIGQTFPVDISSGIDLAVLKGFVIVLLSPNSISSQGVKKEIDYALQLASNSATGANVVPIFLSDPRGTQASMDLCMKNNLSQQKWFNFSNGDFDANMKKLVIHLRNVRMV